MNEMTEKRTPAIIGAEIRMYADAGRRITLLCGIEIGRRRVEAKEMLHHGEWLPWLEEETDFSDRTAARYMQVFKEYSSAQLGLFGPETNSPTLSNLSISKALSLLSLPPEERESFAQEHDAEQLSAREVEALVKERTAALETEKAGLESACKQAEEELQNARRELRELESRPVPVAVERDEKAIEEAVKAERDKHAEAEKDLKQKIKDLNSRIKLADEAKAVTEKEIRELTAKAAEAEKAGAEAPQLRAQIKKLESRLALAAPEVAEFKAAFDRAQGELVKMLDALHKVQDEDVRAKLSEAARAVLTSFEGRV